MKLDTFVNRSYVAQSPNADCEETINLFLETVESGHGKSSFTFYRSPGLKLLVTLPNGGAVRGLLPLNQLPGGVLGGVDGVWVCVGAYVYLINGQGQIIVTRGPIQNDGNRVSMAASPTQLVIQTAGQVYWIDGVAPFLHGPINWFVNPANNLPVVIGSIGFINTYFVFLDLSTGNGFYFSEPGDVSIVPNPAFANFVSAEASANRYTSLKVDRQEIWLFGSLTAQVFYDNSSNDPNNPFAPNLSAVLPVGTQAPGSVLSLSRQLCWIGQSSTSLAVAWTNDGGYIPRRISNHAVEYAWSTYATIQDCQAWGFTMKGHPLARFWFPTADVTWEYDFSVNDWRKVLSWDANAGKYHAHVGANACAAFGQILVGDRTLPNVYTCSMDFLNDNGNRIRWMRRTPILSSENKRVSFPWFELDIQPGVGDGSNADPTQGPVTPEADPQIMMRFSNDWAQTWSNERQRSMGKQGETNKRTIWKRNGISRQRVFECSGSASVKTVINNAYLREPGARTT